MAGRELEEQIPELTFLPLSTLPVGSWVEPHQKPEDKVAHWYGKSASRTLNRGTVTNPEQQMKNSQEHLFPTTYIQENSKNGQVIQISAFKSLNRIDE